MASQSSIIYFTGGGNDKVQKVEPTSDGGFIFCGSTLTDSSNTEAFMLKVDANGNKEWYHTYGGKNYDLFNDAIQCADGGYIGVGITTSLVGNSHLTDYVVKTNAKGELEWSKSYSDKSGLIASANSVIESDDHYFYISGLRQNNVGNLESMNTMLIKINSKGSRFFQTDYYGLSTYKPYLLDMFQVISNAGSNITINKRGEILTSVFLYHRFYGNIAALLSVDRDGIVNFFYPYTNIKSTAVIQHGDDHSQNPGKVICTDDGYYLTVVADSVNGSVTRECTKLIKTDLDGNILWTKVFFGLKHALGLDLMSTASGNIILSGATSAGDIDFSYDQRFSNLKIMIFILDKDGNQISSSFLGSEKNANIIKAMRTDATGNLVGAGYTSLNAGEYNRMFIIKLNANGSLMP